jgi:uncharacterized phage protein (TIGR02220 family)
MLQNNVLAEVVDFALEELERIGCVIPAIASVIHLQGLQSKSPVLEEEKEEEEEKKKNKEEEKEEDIYAKKILPCVSPQENLKTDFCQTVITMLNSLCGSRYPVTKEYCVLIESRKSDGYSLEDFKSVIAFRQSTWANDPKMRQWLRPETLFGTKFYSYLEQSKNPLKSKMNAPKGNPYLEEIRQKYGEGENA